MNCLQCGQVDNNLCKFCIFRQIAALSPFERNRLTEKIEKDIDQKRTFKEKLHLLNSVPIHINISTVIFLAFIGFIQLPNGWFSVVTNISVLIGVYCLVLLHEFGHIYAAHRCGIGVKEVRLYFIGGAAFLESNPTNPRDEFFIAFAGPLVNFVLAGFSLIGALLLTGPLAGSGADYLCVFLLIGNMMLGLFNLLPIFPMDGGRLLRATLWKVTSDVKASTKIAVRTGQLAAIVTIGLSFVYFSIWNIFLALFVLLASQAELIGLNQKLKSPSQEEQEQLFQILVEASERGPFEVVGVKSPSK